MPLLGRQNIHWMLWQSNIVSPAWQYCHCRYYLSTIQPKERSKKLSNIRKCISTQTKTWPSVKKSVRPQILCFLSSRLFCWGEMSSIKCLLCSGHARHGDGIFASRREPFWPDFSKRQAVLPVKNRQMPTKVAQYDFSSKMKDFDPFTKIA